jgi:MSHA pilin protein MshD
MMTAEQNYRLLLEIEANRRFLLMAYQQNPKLLESAEARVKQLFEVAAPAGTDDYPHRAQVNVKLRQGRDKAHSSERGISLIELIMFIVIVSVALAGILLVMNVTTRGSADPLIHKQALAAAESLLEEIELQDFISAAGVNPVNQTNRASQYHTVRDYNGFPNDATTGIYSVNGVAPIAGLENYNARVTVANAALGGITVGSASAVQVTVTVKDPQGNDIQISGYRTAY